MFLICDLEDLERAAVVRVAFRPRYLAQTCQHLHGLLFSRLLRLVEQFFSGGPGEGLASAFLFPDIVNFACVPLELRPHRVEVRACDLREDVEGMPLHLQLDPVAQGIQGAQPPAAESFAAEVA